MEYLQLSPSTNLQYLQSWREHYNSLYLKGDATFTQDAVTGFIEKLHPILGKTTYLSVNAYEFQCDNPDCDATTFVENVNGFLSYYNRMTERCADFICTLAMETKRYTLQPNAECGSAIGVDDFAFKKRHTYGTIIVDEATHKPVAILDGRDGETLKEWLNKNKHVRTVTRDRASAYASAIQEILPDAIQIADRFHLHQNLLEAIKNTVNSLLPVDIRIPSDYDDTKHTVVEDREEASKKNAMSCG